MLPLYGLGALAEISEKALVAGVMMMGDTHRNSISQTIVSIPPLILSSPIPPLLLMLLLALPLFPPVTPLTLPLSMLPSALTPLTSMTIPFSLVLPLPLAPTIPSNVIFPPRIRILRFPMVSPGLFIPIVRIILLRLPFLFPRPLSLPPPHPFLTLLSSSSFLLLLLLRLLPNTSTNRQAMMMTVS